MELRAVKVEASAVRLWKVRESARVDGESVGARRRELPAPERAKDLI
jgi:hypothetical protein